MQMKPQQDNDGRITVLAIVADGAVALDLLLK